MEAPAAGPVVLSNDDFVRAAVLRAAAAAGVVPEFISEPETVSATSVAGSMVLVGVDQVAAWAFVAQRAPARSAATYVLSMVPPDAAVLRDALLCGATAVLELPAEESRLVDLLSDVVDGAMTLGRLIAVVGGSGGAGASTFAAALGITAAERFGSALLVDADRWGGGLDQILGIAVRDGIGWEALGQVTGRLSARSLRETLPRRGELSVVTWSQDRSTPLAATLVPGVMSAGQRGYPVTVVDLPRGDPAVLREVAARCEQLVVLSATTMLGLAATLHLIDRLPTRPDGVVLRGRAGIEAPAVTRLLGVDVWHQMGDQRGLDEAISLGLGPLRSRRGPLSRAARGVLDRLELGAAR